MSERTKRKTYLVVGAVVAVGLLWPWTEDVVPEWTVTVQTTAGEPVAGVPVMQAWRHQTVQSTSETDLRATNARGEVQFPRRQVHVNVARLAVGALGSVMRAWHEAGFGPFGQVIIGIEGQRSGCERLVYMPREPQRESLKSQCVVSDGFSITPL